VKFHRTFLFVTVLLLTYPSHVASQQEKQEQPIPIGGRSGSPSSAEDLKRLREYAEQGNANEQFNLGMMYLQGNGVTQDYAEAAKWLRKAAEQGEIWAQCMLGAIYADGLGITQDYIEAYTWLTLSVDLAADKQSQVIRKATDLRDSVARKMTQQQIEEAQRLAKEWADRLQTGMDNGVYLAGRGVTPPVVLIEARPPYTEEARRSRVQGDALLQFIVRKDGTADSFKIVRRLGYGLDESAIDTVKKRYRFKPGTFQGKPVDVKILLLFNFKLY
jgi:TonB family protein